MVFVDVGKAAAVGTALKQSGQKFACWFHFAVGEEFSDEQNTTEIDEAIRTKIRLMFPLCC